MNPGQNWTAATFNWMRPAHKFVDTGQWWTKGHDLGPQGAQVVWPYGAAKVPGCRAPEDTMQRDSLIILGLRSVQVCTDETLAFFSFHYRVRLRPFDDEVVAFMVCTTRRRQVNVRRRWDQLHLNYVEGTLDKGIAGSSIWMICRHRLQFRNDSAYDRPLTAPTIWRTDANAHIVLRFRRAWRLSSMHKFRKQDCTSFCIIRHVCSTIRKVRDIDAVMIQSTSWEDQTGSRRQTWLQATHVSTRQFVHWSIRI